MKTPRCRVCGCTQDRACVSEDGPCWWVEADLCSACATTAQIAVAGLDRRIKELQQAAADPYYANLRDAIALEQRRFTAARHIVLHCDAWQARRRGEAA
jgi:hypothetical protein